MAEAEPGARPYVLVSVAMTLDGYIDSADAERLIISGEQDWQEVAQLRAGCDAILIGANTLRRDNPRLRIRDPALRRQRSAEGRPADILRLVVSASGDLPAEAQCFQAQGPCWVLCAPAHVPALQARLPAHVLVLPWDGQIDSLLATLAQRGVRRLLLEGGSRLLGQFVEAGRIDWLRLAIGPFFCGQAEAPPLLPPCRPAFDMTRHLRVQRVRLLGQTTVMELCP